MPTGPVVVVVGGGVVGICCALALLRAGYRVTVIDRTAPGDSAAAASCGSIAVSEVLPLSRAGVIRRVPGWLLDPSGPMAIRPLAMLGAVPWFAAFARNAAPARGARIGKGLAGLTARARADLDTLLTDLGLTGLIGDKPVIELYETEAEFETARHHLDARRALGFSCEAIAGREAAEREPAIATDFAKAVVLSDWRSVVDGAGFVKALTEAFRARGGALERGEVASVRVEDGRAAGVALADGSVLDGEHVVLAAGAWTKVLAKPLGLTLAIEAATGYSTILPKPGVDLTYAVVYPRGGFGLTPYESGLAVAGGVEFAGLSGRPNWRRAQILVDKARRVVPGLQGTDGHRLMGRRPLTPDALPIIGPVPGVQNLIVASGHGQLGLTLGATTGRLVADLVQKVRTNFDLTPYRATRFAG